MASSNIQAVILDFGGVICFHPSPKQIAHAAETLGVPVVDFDRALWSNRLEYDAGRTEPEDYWREVADLAGSQRTGVLDHLIHMDAELWNRFDERVLAWVRVLRDRGIGTSILSNLPRPLGQALRGRPGFLEHFDQVTFSYELGLIKPQREIYEHALSGLGVQAEHALFLDDRPRNIEGALSVGLHALLYSSWEDFAGLRNASPSPAARYGLPEPTGAIAASVEHTARRQ